ncbi:hypothetical protein PIB30_066566 [Stylosanthes scabra]|uniref:Uncharacterized protein n=1 Tax=Stylosanthes scabra TaxID=79078 RepID=A0ABU6QN89_9FABA|nr:hypothetical protein [Stylosanthes scabra]
MELYEPKVACMQGNRDKQAIDFDLKIERTLRKLKKKAKQQVVNQVIEEVQQNNMAAVDGNEQTRTLGDYTIPSTASCGSSIVLPNAHKSLRIRDNPTGVSDQVVSTREWDIVPNEKKGNNLYF